MPRLLLVESHRSELLEKQSRFIAVALPCESLEEFKRHRAALEAEFPDARHIAYAYAIQEEQQIYQRFHDANEPSGTAGRPILMHISGRELLNVAVFVIRYFGGIKLGAGGLMRAYGAAARQVLDEAQLRVYVPLCRLRVVLTYRELKHLEYLLGKHGGTLRETQYTEDLHASLELPEEQKPHFLNELQGTSIRCIE